MIADVIEDIKYKNLMEKQIQDIIDYLLVHNEEFSITANIKGVTFNPPIPQSIHETFSNFTMFSLSNYTYSTIVLENNKISFEAGFGKENFGSTVSIPLFCVFQLVVNDSILFINPTATVEKYLLPQNNDEDIAQVERSKKAFSFNPNNKNLV